MLSSSDASLQAQLQSQGDSAARDNRNPRNRNNNNGFRVVVVHTSQVQKSPPEMGNAVFVGATGWSPNACGRPMRRHAVAPRPRERWRALVLANG